MTHSLSSNSRDGAPQVICISFNDFLDGAQLPGLILRHLLEGFFYSVKSPFRGFQFGSENAFVFFPVSSFQRKECPFSSFCEYNQYHSSTSLAPSTLLAGDSCCRWPCIPVCLSFSASPRNFFIFLIFRCKNMLTSLVVYCSFPIIFHNFPRGANFLHKLVPLPLCQWLISSCHQRFVATLLA